MERRLNVPKISRRLAEMNRTVENFKDNVKVDRRTVERLLSGKTKNPQPATVEIIAEFLGLPPRDILIIGAPKTVEHLDPRGVPEVEVHLPITGEYLVGRAREMAQLDSAWSDDRVNIFSLVAWGGTGKSALVNHWLGKLAQNHWQGAERVFGWTFYSQGVRDAVASADGFINAALHYFGDPEPGAGSPEDKGHRLARLVQERRTLLVLDGLEPLQYLPGPYTGRLKDLALATLLRALALGNPPGLCVLTTRLAVADIAAFQSTTAPVLHLDDLSAEAGAELLRALGVHGADAERRAASKEFGGHALALHLLGTYLRDACGGDVRRRQEIGVLDDWSASGGHAWRVMRSYERRFGDGPEVAVLRALGLFDRVADEAEVLALRAEPRIPQLNDALIALSERQWVRTLRRLREAGLVARPHPKMPHTLDAHPLVREYYRHQLREQHPAAWRAGHARLYRHLQDAVGEERPTTMEALVPLYAAVAHGCYAGRVQEALGLFRHRIRHGDHNFSTEQLGAFGADLAALSSFFEVMWSKVVSGLETDDQLFLFHAVGECLSALGRTFEAEAPLRKALEMALRHEHRTTAAVVATQLSEVYRARGDLPTALHFAQQSVGYVNSAGVPTGVALRSRIFLGFVQYWVGQFEAAKATFQEAEGLQRHADPERPMLHSVLGYMYGELLLDHLEGQVGGLTAVQFRQAWGELRRRIRRALTLAEQDALPRDIGLLHVSMGRLYILAWERQVAEESPGGPTPRHGARLPPQPMGREHARSLTALERALRHATTAAECLRGSNHLIYLPRALLTRAAVYRLQGHFDLAQSDVEEVMDIAQSSAMDFYQADAHLEQVALHLTAYRGTRHEDHVSHASVNLDRAKTLIQQMHYYRRNRQVGELEAALQRITADRKARR
jgi:tetratricopeptide (TPR) repeat protein